MTWWVEHRPAVRRFAKPVLVPLESLDGLLGFRSMYAFGDKTADWIRKKGSMTDLRGRPLYSDTLFLDFDDCFDEAYQFREFLQWEFYMYHSGGRSIHFHIPIEPMLDPDVFLQQKKWVKRHAPAADVSIYRPCGLYRLEGTFHRSTKQPKILEDCNDGPKLKIDEHIPAHKVLPTVQPRNPSMTFQTMLEDECGPGNRRPFMFRLIAFGVDLGYTEFDLYQMVRLWNDRRTSPPLPITSFNEYFKKTYEQQARKLKAKSKETEENCA